MLVASSKYQGVMDRHGDVTAAEKSNSDEDFKTAFNPVANVITIRFPETSSVSIRIRL